MSFAPIYNYRYQYKHLREHFLYLIRIPKRHFGGTQNWTYQRIWWKIKGRVINRTLEGRSLMKKELKVVFCHDFWLAYFPVNWTKPKMSLENKRFHFWALNKQNLQLQNTIWNWVEKHQNQMSMPTTTRVNPQVGSR